MIQYLRDNSPIAPYEHIRTPAYGDDYIIINSYKVIPSVYNNALRLKPGTIITEYVQRHVDTSYGDAYFINISTGGRVVLSTKFTEQEMRNAIEHPNTVRVQAITCNYCGDTIYSRSVHDNRYCTCGKVSIDGGFDYTKVSAPDPRKIKEHKITLYNVDKVDLFCDYMYSRDNYGLINNKEENMKFERQNIVITADSIAEKEMARAMSGKYWKASVAAKYLGITTYKLKQLVTEGKVRAVPVGKSYRYIKESIEKYKLYADVQKIANLKPIMEASKETGLSPHTLRYLEKNREIKGLKINGKLHIDVDEVIAYYDAFTVGADIDISDNNTIPQ